MLSWVYYTVLEKFGKLVTVDLYQIVIHWNLYITTLYYATMTKQSLVFKDSLLLSYKCYVWYLIKSAATLYLTTCCFCHLLSIFFFAFSWSNHNLVGYDWGSPFFCCELHDVVQLSVWKLIDTLKIKFFMGNRQPQTYRFHVTTV